MHGQILTFPIDFVLAKSVIYPRLQTRERLSVEGTGSTWEGTEYVCGICTL